MEHGKALLAEPHRLLSQLSAAGYRPRLLHLAVLTPILVSYIAFPNRKLAPLHALRLFALRILLTYKGWLVNAPTSMSTKLYMMYERCDAVCIRILLDHQCASLIVPFARDQGLTVDDLLLAYSQAGLYYIHSI